MPDLSKGTAITTASEGYATHDYEQSKFVVTGGSIVSVRTTVVGGGTISAGTVSLIYGGTVVGTAQPLPVTLQTQLAGEDLTNDVQGNLQKPVASSTYSPSDHTNFGAAAGTGVLIKASAGNVYAADVTSATAAVRYFQLFNQGTVPVVGQTPVASYPLGSVPVGGISRLQLDSTHFAPSKYFSTGIAAAISSTSGTLGTASITAADYSWHIKYV